MQTLFKKLIFLLLLSFTTVVANAQFSSLEDGYYFIAGSYHAVNRDSLLVENEEKNSEGPKTIAVYGPYRTKYGAKKAMKMLKRDTVVELYFSQIFKLK